MRRLLLSSIPRRRSSSSNPHLRQQQLVLQPLSILARHAQGRTITTINSSSTSSIPLSRLSAHHEQSTTLPPLPRPQSRPTARHFSSSAPTTPPSPQLDGGFATERDYHLAADEALDEVQFMVEGLEDTIEDFEANLSQGVLNLIMGPHGTWVLNKQTPNRQIWWSSPLSGPMRFEYDPAQQKWLNTRDKRELFSLLAEEVYRISGVDIRKREQN